MNIYSTSTLTEQNHRFLELRLFDSTSLFWRKRKVNQQDLLKLQYISDKARPPNLNPKLFPSPHYLYQLFESFEAQNIIYRMPASQRFLKTH